MLKNIVDTILNSTVELDSGTIYCKNVIITNEAVVECIEFLASKSIIENVGYNNKVHETISLELSLVRLNSIGFYESYDKFIVKNKYSLPTEPYYIFESKKYSYEESEFKEKYDSVINFINSIKVIAKHTYTDIDIEYSVISRENKSAILELEYDSSNVITLNPNEIVDVKYLTTAYNDANSEKKLLFINELIDFILLEKEFKLANLLFNISIFSAKCNNSFQFYLSDFSSNKFKIELDSKALEFTQKLQGVINDSQNKLIAIPTAFVLVSTTFDFANLTSVKNIGTLISLFIFSLLIQIFLNNQKSTLKFIRENIDSYKETFKKNEIEKISNRFKSVESEYDKQKRRLCLVTFILWFIPIVLLLVWICLIYLHYLDSCLIIHILKTVKVK